MLKQQVNTEVYSQRVSAAVVGRGSFAGGRLRVPLLQLLLLALGGSLRRIIDLALGSVLTKPCNIFVLFTKQSVHRQPTLYRGRDDDDAFGTAESSLVAMLSSSRTALFELQNEKVVLAVVIKKKSSNETAT